MNIEDYKLGQKVSLYGRIEAIDIANIHDKENTTTLKINTLARTISVNPKWEKVTTELNQPKPVVPQFVAEWLEKNDWRKDTSGRQTIFDVFDNLTLDASNGFYVDVKKWVEENGNIFAQAWVFGYEVEKEKLYTVKILGCTLFKMTSDNGTEYKLIGENETPSESKFSSYKFEADLTEQEIKQADERLWQFAKEVTE